MKTNENRNGIPVSAKRGLHRAKRRKQGSGQNYRKGAQKRRNLRYTDKETDKRKIFKGV
ncbi:hypothetical protein ABEW32_23870 [Paenibacillus jamilae]|uniref:hypothetical protein n=1 Tax=Paenibacillus jamilae TaxID=114136 RepID=UPI003D2BA228